MLSLFIGESIGELRSPPDGWIWIRPSTGKIQQYLNYEWTDVPITFDSIVLSGSITTDGVVGLTGTRTIDGKNLTFKNGLLVGYEEA